MSLVLSHFAIGAIMTALLVHLWIPTYAYRGVVIVLGGIWGLIPDLHGVLPWFDHWFRRLDASHWADIFWFHRTMDRLEDGPGSPRVALTLTILLIAIIVATEWRVRQWENEGNDR